LESGLTQFDGRVNLRRAILLGSKGIRIGVLNSIFSDLKMLIYIFPYVEGNRHMKQINSEDFNMA